MSRILRQIHNEESYNIPKGSLASYPFLYHYHSGDVECNPHYQFNHYQFFLFLCFGLRERPLDMSRFRLWCFPAPLLWKAATAIQFLIFTFFDTLTTPPLSYRIAQGAATVKKYNVYLSVGTTTMRSGFGLK